MLTLLSPSTEGFFVTCEGIIDFGCNPEPMSDEDEDYVILNISEIRYGYNKCNWLSLHVYQLHDMGTDRPVETSLIAFNVSTGCRGEPSM